ncbi:septum formation initiator family protein, partial [Rhodococcus sp. NPDC059234]|uniref:FtsB family cell division protein n=1 Tax=Rhodococcus sp. NPDC059234 TaxID=3346781 RepID=UPI00366E7D2E
GRRGAAERGEERTFLGLSTAKAVTLGVVVCALALTLAMPLRTYLTQRTEAEQLAEQKDQLEDDVARLTREKEQSNDPARIKAEARNRLQYVMPGETPYQVQLPGATAPPVETLNKPKRSGNPWYTDLWRPIVEPQPQVTPSPTPPPGPVPDPANTGSMTIPHDQGGPVG